jgi:hypothetical protein
MQAKRRIIRMRVEKTFEKCPACGHVGTIVQDRVNELITEEKLSPGTKLAALVSQSPLVDPRRQVILAKKTISGIITIYDVCSNCGCLYCVAAQEVEMQMKPQDIPMPKGNQSPPFISAG